MSDKSDGQVNQVPSQENQTDGEQQSSTSSSENSLRNRTLAGLGRVMHELGSRLVEKFDDNNPDHSQSP